MVQSFFTLDLGKCVFRLLDSVNPSWKEKKKNIVNVEISFLMAAAAVVVVFLFFCCFFLLRQMFKNAASKLLHQLIYIKG